MLYSGVDLIRTSTALHERMERLQSVDSVQPVTSPQNPTSNLDEPTQNALLRFARFVNKENEKKKSSPKPSQFKKKGIAANPYIVAENRSEKLFGRGQSLDVYV